MLNIVRSKIVNLAQDLAKANEFIAEINNSQNPRLTNVATFSQQSHAIESVVNGGVVEKAFGLAMIANPYNEKPLTNIVLSSGLGICKLKRLGFVGYVYTHTLVSVGSVVATKPYK